MNGGYNHKILADYPIKCISLYYIVTVLTPDEIISTFINKIADERRSCSRDNVHQAVDCVSF